MGIYTSDLINHPLMDALILALLEHHILQHLEILGDSSLVTIDAVLQLGNDTDGLSALVDHLEGVRDLTYLKGIHGFGNLGREILHAEPRRRMTSLHHVRGHQTLTVTGVLIVGQDRGSILEGELPCTKVTCNGVKTGQCLVDGLIRNHRLTEDVAHVDFLTTLLDELDDMETEL